MGKPLNQQLVDARGTTFASNDSHGSIQANRGPAQAPIRML